MKILIYIAGTLTGLVLVRVLAYADKCIERYANHSLPTEYVGPKYMRNGKWVDSL